MLDFDLQAQAQAARFIRQIFQTEPFASMAGSETSPGLSSVAAGADDQGWSSFIKNNCMFLSTRVDAKENIVLILRRSVKLPPN
jgi:hypothetical protein